MPTLQEAISSLQAHFHALGEKFHAFTSAEDDEARNAARQDFNATMSSAQALMGPNSVLGATVSLARPTTNTTIQDGTSPAVAGPDVVENKVPVSVFGKPDSVMEEGHLVHVANPPPPEHMDTEDLDEHEFHGEAYVDAGSAPAPVPAEEPTPGPGPNHYDFGSPPSLAPAPEGAVPPAPSAAAVETHEAVDTSTPKAATFEATKK